MIRGRLILTIIAGLGLAVATIGCKSSSHKSVRTYDYSDDPRDARRVQQPIETEREIESGDYEMVAPGEMVPPGKPVVDPR